MTAESEHTLQQAAAAVRNAKHAIAVTGAGMSAESGIPTFRDTGGIWEKYPIEEYATIYAYLENPHKVWKFWTELAAMTHDCGPNPGHVALAALEQRGKLHAVITQNIDNLHQMGGSKHVIEYHGNARRLRSMTSNYSEPLDPDNMPATPPHCPAGGLMKPDVIMFGEMIPEEALVNAEREARRADVVIVVGTSAQVFPAAQLPVTAKHHGAKIIEVNIEQTDFTTEGITDYFLHGPAGVMLPQLAEAVG